MNRCTNAECRDGRVRGGRGVELDLVIRTTQVGRDVHELKLASNRSSSRSLVPCPPSVQVLCSCQGFAGDFEPDTTSSSDEVSDSGAGLRRGTARSLWYVTMNATCRQPVSRRIVLRHEEASGTSGRGSKVPYRAQRRDDRARHVQVIQLRELRHDLRKPITCVRLCFVSLMGAPIRCVPVVRRLRYS